jgi:hypothetical protein
MENLNDALDFSFCQILENFRRETARLLFAETLVLWGLGRALAKTLLCGKGRIRIVPCSLKKWKFSTKGIFRNSLLLSKGLAHHALCSSMSRLES